MCAAHSKGGDADDAKSAKKELNFLLKEHADAHGDALLLEDLIMKNKSGTKPFLVDPMHALELNLMKTLWKYCFGDRMSDSDRELVAEYLSSIGLHLDIRPKGKRDPQTKWFSAAQCDEFMLGDAHYKKSKSPGMVKNILSIVEIIFDKNHCQALLLCQDAEPAPVPKKAKTARKDRHTAQVPGGYGAAEVAATPAAPHDLSFSELNGAADSDRSELMTHLRSRYGNQSGVVIKIMVAWEAYGELFSEWREEWTGDTDDYRARRALRLARRARDFQIALCSVSNYKQKSWYTHALVWIVPQQLFYFGNTWPLSTIAIESRNARIKKYGRRFTNWRPLVDGFTSYSYIDRRSKKQVNSERRYNSSAVHQLLERVALSEQGWHTNTRFTSTDKLRLQTQLRSTLIKVEIADAPPTLPPVSILSELFKRLETP